MYQKELLNLGNFVHFLLHFQVYSEKIWRGFNLAQGKNEIFGADIIWFSQIFLKFGAYLIWRSEKNIKFSADLIWHNQRIFDKFIKKYEQFKNVKQEQY